MNSNPKSLYDCPTQRQQDIRENGEFPREVIGTRREKWMICGKTFTLPNGQPATCYGEPIEEDGKIHCVECELRKKASMNKRLNQCPI